RVGAPRPGDGPGPPTAVTPAVHAASTDAGRPGDAGHAFDIDPSGSADDDPARAETGGQLGRSAEHTPCAAAAAAHDHDEQAPSAAVPTRAGVAAGLQHRHC